MTDPCYMEPTKIETDDLLAVILMLFHYDIEAKEHGNSKDFYRWLLKQFNISLTAHRLKKILRRESSINDNLTLVQLRHILGFPPWPTNKTKGIVVYRKNSPYEGKSISNLLYYKNDGGREGIIAMLNNQLSKICNTNKLIEHLESEQWNTNPVLAALYHSLKFQIMMVSYPRNQITIESANSINYTDYRNTLRPELQNTLPTFSSFSPECRTSQYLFTCVGSNRNWLTLRYSLTPDNYRTRIKYYSEISKGAFKYIISNINPFNSTVILDTPYYFYILLFNNGIIKFGQTIDLNKRLKNHRDKIFNPSFFTVIPLISKDVGTINKLEKKIASIMEQNNLLKVQHHDEEFFLNNVSFTQVRNAITQWIGILTDTHNINDIVYDLTVSSILKLSINLSAQLKGGNVIDMKNNRINDKRLKLPSLSDFRITSNH